ncbi:MAG: penicillin acylase family protein, partial [Bacteroidia bacterium]|nr:penicillin acylase family protein [Bacteroidia bacterium]
MNRWVKFLLILSITIGVTWALNNKLGDIPPLGKFLNPFHGCWQNAEINALPQTMRLQLSELEQPVTVQFDERLVPHIFAQTDRDLYFVQGYVTAMLRLWQMEFQTHAAAGRISEIVGEKAVEFDRFKRRSGMSFGAKRALEALEQDPDAKLAITAYSDGVNAYISKLKKRDYPLEYKLLDYQPELWSPYKTALLLKMMAWDLSGNNSDYQMTNVLKELGSQTVAELFPNYPAIMDPIVPRGTKWDFIPEKLPVPAVDSLTQRNLTSHFQSQSTIYQWEEPTLGSNNWAVGATKSATGFPILANDPHLGLNLPSLWLEMQLVSPTVNVYGATLPGAPTVIIGFNQNIAWGVTNVDPDVFDWYRIQFKDASMKQYWHDGVWKETQIEITEIKVRGKESVWDTIVYTHHGPIVLKTGETPYNQQTPPMCAMRWLAHDPSNELKTFWKLNRAKSYEEYVEALTYYTCPAQNFIYADNQKNIALWSNGKFPLRYRGQGKFILDGTNSAF